MFCVKCGKQIADGSKFCPECGAVQPDDSAKSTAYSSGPINTTDRYSTVRKAQYNIMCIVGLVVSCISLLINFWGLVGIAGTVISVIGLITCTRRNENGKILAIIGIIIGVISIIYALVVLLSIAGI